MKGLLHSAWWARRDTLLMFGGKSTSLLGDTLLGMALLMYVHDAGYGELGVTALLLTDALPLILLARIAGRVADTQDSRRVLLAVTAIQAASVFCLLTTHSLMGIVTLLLVIQSAQAISSATWSGLGPRIVSEENVGKSASAQQAISAVVMPVGSTLGPAFAGWWGPHSVVVMDAVSQSVLLLAIRSIRTRRHVQSSIPEINTSFAVLRQNTLMWWFTIALIPTVGILVAGNVLDVFFVRDQLKLSSSWYGLGMLVMGAGSLIGAIAASKMSTTTARRHAIIRGLAVIAVGFTVIGVCGNYAEYLALDLLVGAANGLVNACFGTLMITTTNEDERGRISASLNGLFQAAALFGLPVGGLAGAAFGTRPAIITLGCIATLLIALSAIRLRHAPANPILRSNGPRIEPAP